jgi:hypothetical protein
MPDKGLASGESSQPSEGRYYPIRRRNEPAPDEGDLTDSISMILIELRLMKKEMASNKTELEETLSMITHNIHSTADQDTAFSAKTASKETVERMDGRATEAQPKRQGRQRQGEMVVQLGLMETRTSISKWRQKRCNVSKWAVVASTLRH